MKRWWKITANKYTSDAVLDMEVEGVRPRGRSTLSYMNTVKRDIKKNGLTDVNILDRNDWRMAVSTRWRGRALKLSRWKYQCTKIETNPNLRTSRVKISFDLKRRWCFDSSFIATIQETWEHKTSHMSPLQNIPITWHKHINMIVLALQLHIAI